MAESPRRPRELGTRRSGRARWSGGAGRTGRSGRPRGTGGARWPRRARRAGGRWRLRRARARRVAGEPLFDRPGARDPIQAGSPTALAGEGREHPPSEQRPVRPDLQRTEGHADAHRSARTSPHRNGTQSSIPLTVARGDPPQDAQHGAPVGADVHEMVADPSIRTYPGTGRRAPGPDRPRRPAAERDHRPLGRTVVMLEPSLPNVERTARCRWDHPRASGTRGRRRRWSRSRSRSRPGSPGGAPSRARLPPQPYGALHAVNPATTAPTEASTIGRSRPRWGCPATRASGCSERSPRGRRPLRSTPFRISATRTSSDRRPPKQPHGTRAPTRRPFG